MTASPIGTPQGSPQTPLLPPEGGFPDVEEASGAPQALSPLPLPPNLLRRTTSTPPPHAHVSISFADRHFAKTPPPSSSLATSLPTRTSYLTSARTTPCDRSLEDTIATSPRRLLDVSVSYQYRTLPMPEEGEAVSEEPEDLLLESPLEGFSEPPPTDPTQLLRFNPETGRLHTVKQRGERTAREKRLDDRAWGKLFTYLTRAYPHVADVKIELWVELGSCGDHPLSLDLYFMILNLVIEEHRAGERWEISLREGQEEWTVLQSGASGVYETIPSPKASSETETSGAPEAASSPPSSPKTEKPGAFSRFCNACSNLWDNCCCHCDHTATPPQAKIPPPPFFTGFLECSNEEEPQILVRSSKGTVTAYHPASKWRNEKELEEDRILWQQFEQFLLEKYSYLPPHEVRACVALGQYGPRPLDLSAYRSIMKWAHRVYRTNLWLDEQSSLLRSALDKSSPQAAPRDPVPLLGQVKEGNSCSPTCAHAVRKYCALT